MIENAKPPVRKIKPPTPRYHYKLVRVTGSQEAHLMEKALREQLGEMGFSLFAIGHTDGSYDVMADSGGAAASDSVLRAARAFAARVRAAG